ncbi:MAG: M48 family metalloprotease [Candidatus Dactylopiibacterium sp.]|nr:M48 family metalloprotease [Candidatus Dactylopiibacterium sp.]
MSSLPDLGDPSQEALSPAQERRIAEEVMRTVRFREPAYLDDPEVEEYVNALGHALSGTLPAQGNGFQFFVLRDATINAFAMPGGVIGVHSGLIVMAQTESELASVLGHEIGHIVQHHMARMLARQSNTTALMLASILLAVLAGRNSGNAAGAVLASGQAAAIQSSLAYSRDYEREADRVGLQILSNAGFDINGMPAFFERLLSRTRMLENSAPAYLRTHPLTQDRIADIGARVSQMRALPHPGSIDFLLVRAKLEVAQLGAQTAIGVLLAREAKTRQEQSARWYGLARAYLASNRLDDADKAYAELQRLRPDTAMLASLGAELERARGRFDSAAKLCGDARAQYPLRLSPLYCEVESWLAGGKPAEALKLLDPLLRVPSSNYRLYVLQAKAETALGHTTQAHRAQAEVYLLQGDFSAAADQLQLAQRAGGGNYQEQAAIDARLREVRRRIEEQARDR